MPSFLEKALVATKETKQIDFKQEFDVNSLGHWCEIIKDIAAFANSGGGIILVGINNDGVPSGTDLSSVMALDPAVITDKIYSYTDIHFSDIEIISLTKDDHPIAALKIGAAKYPLIFTKPGTYPIPGNRQSTAFGRGTIYFRHGAKSEPGVSDDIRVLIDRRLREIRKEWLSGVSKVFHAPEGTVITLQSPEAPADVIHSTSPTAIPIRIVDDTSTTGFGLIDTNTTYPYRQIDVVSRLRELVPGLFGVKSYDIQAVRKTQHIEEQKKFFYKPRFSSPQYSEAFVQWLIQKYSEDPDFFVKAKVQYHTMISS